MRKLKFMRYVLASVISLSLIFSQTVFAKEVPPGIAKQGRTPGKGSHKGWEQGKHKGWDKKKSEAKEESKGKKKKHKEKKEEKEGKEGKEEKEQNEK